MLYQLSYGGNWSGAEGDRTPDLSVANAALSQLSYGPPAVLLSGRDRIGMRRSFASPTRALRRALMGPTGLTSSILGEAHLE